MLKIVLLLCLFGTSACSLDLSLKKESQNSSTPSPPVGVSGKLSTIDFRTNAENLDWKDLYISNDDSTFSFVMTIPADIGRIRHVLQYSPEKKRAYFTSTKNSASPSDWPENTLWITDGTSSGTKKLLDLPPTLESCTLVEHTLISHLYCYDNVQNNTLSYQFEKSNPVLQSLSEQLNYQNDSNFLYAARSLSSFYNASSTVQEFIAIYKVPTSSPDDHGVLQKIYLYLDDHFQEITVAPSDWDHLVEAGAIGPQEGVDTRFLGKSFISTFNYDTSEVNLDVITVTNGHPLLTRVPVSDEAWMIGVVGDSVLFRVNNAPYLKKFDSDSNQLIDTSFPTNSQYHIINNHLIIFDDWVYGQSRALRKCDSEGHCEVLANDVSSFIFLSSYSGEKWYFREYSLPLAQQSLKYLDVTTGSIETASTLTTYFKNNSIDLDQIMSVEETSYHIIIKTSDGYTNRVFDISSKSFIDSFKEKCAASSDEVTESVEKENKYLFSSDGSVKYLNRHFGCA